MDGSWRLGTLTACGAFLFSLIAGCGAGPKGPGQTPRAPTAKSKKLVKMVTPARLIPEIDSDQLASSFSEPGVEKYLVAGMRFVIYDDGRVVRANQRFPRGDIQALALPTRLGGGFAFYGANSHRTPLWRAQSWTAELKPLMLHEQAITEVIPGFDRLYLRSRSNVLVAIDSETGDILPAGRLPIAPRLGHMVFADGWRAVIDTELRGPLTTFDAGASWQSLGISEGITDMMVVEGDPVLNARSGLYRVDARGNLHFEEYTPASRKQHVAGSALRGRHTPKEEAPPGVPRDHALGDRALRTVLTKGWPDTRQTAVVLHRGDLFRVSLPDAAILSRQQTEVSDSAQCQGARVGSGFGFICGEEEGKTSIHRVTFPLSVSEVASFPSPRFVSASGNGALVVRGACQGEGKDGPAMRSYCIIHSGGEQREIAVRGELGAERVIAMKDGRVVVLVPPRLSHPGRLTIIDGNRVKGHDLTYPKEPRRAVKVARRGLWLEGFEQRGDKSIGGWVEAGGPAVGVRITLDGKVTPGKIYDEGGQMLTAGRFALATSDAETGFASTDGGKTWREFELPRLPESPGDAKTRGCSPVGCALRGWLRVGWGKLAVKDDLKSVAAPAKASRRATIRPNLSLECHIVAGPSKAATPKTAGTTPYSTWAPFRDVAPPPLAKNELGVDKASHTVGGLSAHVYAWGAKGADWSRNGWWQIRFEDPFATETGVHASAPTRSPWSDALSAADAIGARQTGSYRRWEAKIDASGEAAIASVCLGSNCDHYAVSDGRPVLALSPGTAQFTQRLRPVAGGVARVGETWYMLTRSQAGGALQVWRADLGVLRPLVTLRSLQGRKFGTVSTPRLVRRHVGSEIGLLFTIRTEDASGEELVVLPLDPFTKQLQAPIVLGPSDFEGRVPRHCTEHDDGWMLDMTPANRPSVHLIGVGGYIDNIRLRVRLEAGDPCLVGISANAGRALQSSDKRAAPEGFSIPMAVRERYRSDRRWGMMCRSR